MNTDNRLYFTFPGGARRAVTLSFDDGTVHDRRLVEAFNRHGLKATFNLVPGRFGRDGVVSRDEVATLYAGHEIASHGWMHLNLDRLDPYRRLAEIRDGRAALEDLLGRPVRGFASPYGAHGDAAVDAMREAGVAYARTAGSSNDARWPVPDLLRWTQVSHERRALPLVEGALAKDGWGGTLNALALWGHGYEFEGRWDDLEALCSALGGREGVWYCTNIELADYAVACASVVSTLDGTVVRNLSATAVHASWGPDHGGGEGAVAFTLAPGQALDLKTLGTAGSSSAPPHPDPVVRILVSTTERTDSTETAEGGSPAGEAGERSEPEGVSGSPAGGAGERSEPEGVSRHSSPVARHSGAGVGPRLCWPGFRRKAVTFSYDDGVRNDRRLVELLNRHGLRGTFNLNSGKLSADDSGDDAWNVRAREVASLYAGHEVAVHGLRHESWNVTLPAVAAADIARDRLTLEALAGHPVEGSAYPCGGHSKGPAADSALRALGIVHARVVASRDDFAVPADFLDWNPTMHHSRPDAADLARRFLDAADAAAAEPALFYVWGHSYEFRTEEDWAKMDELCALFGGRDDVWAATNVEICRYVLAFRALRGSLDGRILENPTAIPLWLVAGGRPVVLKPGERLA